MPRLNRGAFLRVFTTLGKEVWQSVYKSGGKGRTARFEVISTLRL